MSLQAENRREAYNEVKPKSPLRRELIYGILIAHPEGMTAEDMTDTLLKLGAIRYYDLNFTRPRLTELAQAGLITAAGRVKSERTNRSVTLWKVSDDV